MQSLVTAVHSAQTEISIADIVLDHIRPLIGADLGVVAAVAEDGSTLEFLSTQIAATDLQMAWTESPLATSSPIPLCMHAQRTLILESAQEFLAVCPELSDAFGPIDGAALAIPLHLQNRVRGGVGFFWREPRPLPEWEVAFVEAAVTLAAQAVERTRRHESELKDAQDATRDALFHALTKSEARLSQAQSVARIGSWEVDTESGTAVWSEEMFRILEFDPAEGVPAYPTFFSRLHPEDISLYKEMERKGREEGDPRDFELRVLYSDGRLGWLHSLGRSERDDTGKIVRTFGTLMDITERKEMEQALRENDERLRAILDQTPAGIIFAEAPSGRIVLANREMDRILGRSVALSTDASDYDPSVCRMDGKPMLPEDYPLSRVIRHGEVVSHEEILIERPDGNRLVCLANAGPIYNNEGVMIAAVLALLDIDEHKKLQQQFHQSQKMEGIGRLAGGIAHDFNNLLTLIMGYAEIIEDDLPEDSPQRPQVRTIADAAYRAGSMTRQLLSFARRQPTEATYLSPDSTIQDTVRILRPLIGENIHLQTSLSAGTGCIRIDAHQLEQILVNLVLNARDAMPQGGMLTLSSTEETIAEKRIQAPFVIPAGDYIVISVADTGTGMEDSVRARIFDPFFTTKEVGKGTGLGLATVYGVLKQNDAYIEVTSEIGKGTTFTLYFPRTQEPIASLAVVETYIPSLRGVETVLVVEDEPDVRQMIVVTLRRNGFDVLQAENGVEAMKISEAFQGKIDLLLTDAIMPNMGGSELSLRIRAQRESIRVLLASGYSEDTFTDSAVLPPDTAILAKPFTPSRLLQKVRDVLAGTPGG
ncbi:MAG: two-component sensory box histidine kinase/response regulator [Chthonomonadales bacterium]|nr:two-component sensory box histidine kinase/response regulator [Chthonomonadales bacterium]